MFRSPSLQRILTSFVDMFLCFININDSPSNICYEEINFKLFKAYWRCKHETQLDKKKILKYINESKLKFPEISRCEKNCDIVFLIK